MAEAAPPAHPPPPRPPPSSSHQLHPHPAVAGASAVQKRKHEVEEFKQTSYFKIRAIVRDLRASFLEVCRAPDLQSSKAVDEIKKKLKTIAELYRHAGTERASRLLHTPGFAQDSYKQHHPQQQQIPTQVKVEYKQKTHLPSESVQQKINTNAKYPDVAAFPAFQPSSEPHHPRTTTTTATQPSSEPHHPRMTTTTATQPSSVHHPPRSSSSTTTTNPTLPSNSIEHPLGGAAAIKGTYVVGGSPLGWNFVAYHTSAAPIYGGMSKTEWLAKRVSAASAAGTTTTTAAGADTTAAAAANTSSTADAATVK